MGGGAPQIAPAVGQQQPMKRPRPADFSDEQLKKKYGDRVNDSDWEYLITHWMSPDFEVRTEIAKANRAKLAIHHTSGTKSFARSRHELGHELGRPLDEMKYISKLIQKKVVFQHRMQNQSLLREALEVYMMLSPGSQQMTFCV
ncbi:uncharacterized protein [Miscanthus floridulus]|uniref:uncharacterized protein n=1 Tax=Miscanthus floridulus TaxID=154761 RepID=UPI003458E237